MRQQRKHLETAELERQIAKFGRLLRKLETLAFDVHLMEPMQRLRAAYRAAASARKLDVIRLCRSPDCLNRDRGLQTKAQQYCSERCYARERRRRYLERRDGHTPSMRQFR